MIMANQVPQTYEQREGKVARMIEQQSPKIPTDLFLIAAGASVVGSLAIQLATAGRRRRLGLANRGGQLSLFVGQWAPTFLMLGLYNKMLKLAQQEGRLSR